MFEMLKTFGPILAIAVVLVSVLYNSKITKQREVFCKEHHKETEEIKKRLNAHDVQLGKNDERYINICKKLDEIKEHNADSGKWRNKYNTMFADIDRNLKLLIREK